MFKKELHSDERKIIERADNRCDIRWDLEKGDKVLKKKFFLYFTLSIVQTAIMVLDRYMPLPQLHIFIRLVAGIRYTQKKFRIDRQ